MQLKKNSSLNLFFALIIFSSILIVSCNDDPPTKPIVLPLLSSSSGDYIKAVMGDTTDIEIVAKNSSQQPSANTWVIFTKIIGDGSLIVDSVETDVDGKAVCQYIFDGALGHAEIQAKIRNVDSILIAVRANTLIPGTTGQGQYVLMEDTYSEVKNLNGTPERVDADPSSWILYAVYESSLGVVVVIEDINQDSTLTDTSNVLGIIVNTVYTGKTKDSIGIGSLLSDFVNYYTDSVVTFYPAPNPQTNPPTDPAYAYRYPTEGLTFWTSTNGNELIREVFEIHLSELVTPAPIPVKKRISDDKSITKSIYKRYRP